MGKGIIIRQDSLLKLKESIDGIGANNYVSSKPSYNSVNEAAPEVDEFEIGEESNNPPAGGNYYHIAESKMEIPQKLIDFVIKNKPDKYSTWAVVDLFNLSTFPRYFEKKAAAYDFYRFMRMGGDRKPVMLNLDKISLMGESKKRIVVSERQLNIIKENFGLEINDSASINEGVNYEKFCASQALRYKVLYKMVEDGYLFHGNEDEWTEFDQNKIKGGSRGVHGYGAYFTNAAYKCEEYGNNFMILDSSNFNFIDINKKVKKGYNIFIEKLLDYNKLKNAIENSRSNREYDFYNSLLEEYDAKVDKGLLEKFVALIESYPNEETYRTLNKNVGGYEDVDKEVSELYLAMGYDGFVCDNQFVIFNFEKLNQNIVKDKEALISKYIVSESTSKSSSFVNEVISKFKNVITLLKEEYVGDGNSEKNPYKERWAAERKALKDFVCNNGIVMQSKEDDKDGKLYKCYRDEGLSNLIGYNYCLCVQWDDVALKPKSIVYIRACDKFTPNIKQSSFDTRGRDNDIRTKF